MTHATRIDPDLVSIVIALCVVGTKAAAAVMLQRYGDDPLDLAVFGLGMALLIFMSRSPGRPATGSMPTLLFFVAIVGTAAVAAEAPVQLVLLSAAAGLHFGAIRHRRRRLQRTV